MLMEKSRGSTLSHAHMAFRATHSVRKYLEKEVSANERIELDTSISALGP